jgi:hypothetical protein
MASLLLIPYTLAVASLAYLIGNTAFYCRGCLKDEDSAASEDTSDPVASRGGYYGVFLRVLRVIGSIWLTIDASFSVFQTHSTFQARLEAMAFYVCPSLRFPHQQEFLLISSSFTLSSWLESP